MSPNTTYYFDVGAFNNAGTNWGAYAHSATTFPAFIAPSFTATAVSSTQIDLAWNQVDGANGYYVAEWTSSGWTLIGVEGSGTTSFAVNNLSPDTTYYFDVGAFNNAGTSWGAYAHSATTFQQTSRTNTLWSGYVITPSSQVQAVGASWVQPAVTSTGQGSTVSFWVGIDGYGGKTVEQIGTSWSASSGYQAWIEFYGDGVQNSQGQWTATGNYFYQTSINSIIGYNYFNVRPGDTISAYVAFVSSTGYTSTFEIQVPGRQQLLAAGPDDAICRPNTDNRRVDC